MGWQEKAIKARKGHRPSLKNWERDGLAQTFPPYAEALLQSDRPYQSFEMQNGEAVERSLRLDDVRGDGDGSNRKCGGGGGSSKGKAYPVVLDAARTPPRVFHAKYEAQCVPVVIRDVPYGASVSRNDAANNDGNRDDDGDVNMEEEKKECDGHDRNSSNTTKEGEWPAVRRWTLDALARDPHLADRPLKCGEDDDGYTIRMKLSYFLEYLKYNRDDSPLYIFDATFDEDRYAKRILEDYTVPEYFDEDLLGLVGGATEAAVSLVFGWAVPVRNDGAYRPVGDLGVEYVSARSETLGAVPAARAQKRRQGPEAHPSGEDDEAIHYFTTILPRMKRKAAASGGKGEYANFACYEFTQFAGETVFVPHGWWHAVLNVTHTVGITQNYCSRRNFDEVWSQTRGGRKKMACTWLRRLAEQHPDLAKRAKELNRRDGFVMWEDDPEEQRRWRKKRAEKEKKKREKKERRKEKKRAEEQQSKPSKKEKWGDHRTTERRKEGSNGDAEMREVSAGDY